MPNFPSIYLELQELWKKFRNITDDISQAKDDIINIQADISNGVSPSGDAGGILVGNYPNPTGLNALSDGYIPFSTTNTENIGGFFIGNDINSFRIKTIDKNSIFEVTSDISMSTGNSSLGSAGGIYLSTGNGNENGGKILVESSRDVNILSKFGDINIDTVNGNISIDASGNGAELTLESGINGAINIYTPNSETTNTGDINIKTGNSTANTPGNINISAGVRGSVLGGDINLTTSNTGDINLTAGADVNIEGELISLESTNGNSISLNSNLKLTLTSSSDIEMKSTSGNITISTPNTSKYIKLLNLDTDSDPQTLLCIDASNNIKKANFSQVPFYERGYHQNSLYADENGVPKDFGVINGLQFRNTVENQDEQRIYIVRSSFTRAGYIVSVSIHLGFQGGHENRNGDLKFVNNQTKIMLPFSAANMFYFECYLDCVYSTIGTSFGQPRIFRIAGANDSLIMCQGDYDWDAKVPILNWYRDLKFNFTYMTDAPIGQQDLWPATGTV